MIYFILSVPSLNSPKIKQQLAGVVAGAAVPDF